MIRALLLVLLLWALPANALLGPGIGGSPLSAPGGGGASSAPATIGWSLLGIKANGTDQTTAINSLCNFGYCNGTTVITCDTGASNTVLISGQIVLASNEKLNWLTDASACPISLPWNDPNQNNTIFTQANLNLPVVGASIVGGALDCGSNTNVPRLWRLWTDHFTWTDTTITNCNQLGIFRGSDVEIARLVITNCLQLTGNPGFRWLRNSPQVTSIGKPTVDGVVANVWIHDNNICNGDGALQVSPGQTTQLWGDTPSDTDGVVYQNNVVSSTSGPAVLIGDGAAAGTYSGTIQNVVVDGVSGTCGNTCVSVSASADGGITTKNIIVKTCTLDDTADTSASASLFIRQVKTTFITIDGCNISNANNFTVRLDGNTSNITVQNSTFGAARNCSTANFFVRDAQSVTISGNTIAAATGCDALLFSPTGHFTQTATVDNNTFTNILDTQWGLHWVNIDSGEASGNTFTPAAGTTSSKGIDFTAASGSDPGTTNTTSNNNNPSAVTGTKVGFTCNGGTTNQAINNTGATDHTCP